MLPRGVGEELFHSSEDPLLVVTPDGMIIEVNDALLLATGKPRTEIIGHGVCEIIHGGRWPHIECPLEEFLRTKATKIEETRLPGLNGEYCLSIYPVSYGRSDQELILLCARKLTQEEVRRVDSLRTAQLAALGELAAGVAHEVNNPINGIINFAQVLLDDCRDDDQQAYILRKIMQEGERVATITHNLLSFAREDENEFIIIDLNDVVVDSIALVEHQLENDGIMVETALCEDGCPIIGNHMQLMQVVLNLIHNSRYALNERYPEKNDDKIISFQSVPALVDGLNFYRLTVRDHGTGIPQGILDRLFDPFFSSKQPGKGTGLGLSISHGIIQNHHGNLRVDSRLHHYTEMIIEIPAQEKTF